MVSWSTARLMACGNPLQSAQMQHRFSGEYRRGESGKSRISSLLAQAASGSFQCLVRTRAAKPPFSWHAEIARGAASRAAAR